MLDAVRDIQFFCEWRIQNETRNEREYFRKKRSINENTVNEELKEKGKNFPGIGLMNEKKKLCHKRMHVCCVSMCLWMCAFSITWFGIQCNQPKLSFTYLSYLHELCTLYVLLYGWILNTISSCSFRYVISVHSTQHTDICSKCKRSVHSISFFGSHIFIKIHLRRRFSIYHLPYLQIVALTRVLCVYKCRFLHRKCSVVVLPYTVYHIISHAFSYCYRVHGIANKHWIPCFELFCV